LYQPLEKMTPEAAFERQWALTILERAMRRLRQDFAGTYQPAEFEQLEAYLTGSEPRTPYKDTAARLGRDGVGRRFGRVNRSRSCS
jgi:hypothetical protein